MEAAIVLLALSWSISFLVFLEVLLHNHVSHHPLSAHQSFFAASRWSIAAEPGESLQGPAWDTWSVPSALTGRSCLRIAYSRQLSRGKSEVHVGAICVLEARFLQIMPACFKHGAPEQAFATEAFLCWEERHKTIFSRDIPNRIALPLHSLPRHLPRKRENLLSEGFLGLCRVLFKGSARLWGGLQNSPRFDQVVTLCLRPLVTLGSPQQCGTFGTASLAPWRELSITPLEEKTTVYELCRCLGGFLMAVRVWGNVVWYSGALINIF